MTKKKRKFELTENARIVLEKRYLRKDDEGRVIESPEQLFERVARAISSPEGRDRAKRFEQFLDAMLERRFMPNSPTLMNAGQPEQQLSACYVLPVEDDLGGIFDSLKYAAKIHQSGGGTGFSFSKLRPKGAAVKSTHGVASGPVSFMKIFDVATETIKQGGARRGANMGILRVDHPDIFEFIESKRNQRSIENFNISVGITNEFMTALKAGASFSLRDPRTRRPTHEVSAQDVFDRIVSAAWECGDPGLIFLDRVNQMNPTPQLGEIESTNPCGEQPLLAYESCNLGSINLGQYHLKSGLNWTLLAEDVKIGVRFLDNVIDVNRFPVRETERITRRNRKIGLGLMGFADLLLMMGIPYGSEDSFRLAERIMSFVDREAKRCSMDLARKKGAFPNWKGSLWQKLGYPKMRNATVSTIAPTGTISIIAGASSGIEPIFSGVFYRNILSGERLLDVHPAIARIMKERGVGESEITDELIERSLGSTWRPAQKVSIEGHVRMQAAFQRHSDSAVSKTINLAADQPPSEIARAYRMAYDFGCKGITVYRDKSRGSQVLDHVVCRTC